MSFIDRSLRLKISLGVSLALLLLLLPFNWLQYQLQRSAALADLSRLAGTTGAVAEDSLEWAMLNNNRQAIQTVVDGVAQVQEVRAVYLLDLQARVAASPAGKLNGQQLDQKSVVCQGCHRYPAASRPRSTFVTAADGQPLFRTMTPIVNGPACEACHSPQDRLNGVLYVDFSLAGLNERLNRQLTAALAASLAIVVIAALAIYLLLSRLVIVPMEQVGRALRRFTGGDRAARIYVGSPDEIGTLATGFNEMAGTIQAQAARAEQLYGELEAKDALRSQLLRRLTAAREDERRSFARELHDELGQLLTGMSLHLRLARQAIPDSAESALEHLDRAGGLIGETIEESHRMIADLRPTVLDDLGLIPALREELRHRLAPLEIESQVEAVSVEALPPEVATAAFRIAQEAITNVIRHAKAQRVDVRVTQTAEALTMTISDDGAGLPAAIAAGTPASCEALGILGMQERAEALGGRLTVSGGEPCGTRVDLWIPLDRGAR